MNTPRYILYVGKYDVFPFNTLTEALEYKGLRGGIIYEPLGMTTAEKVVKEQPIYVNHGDEVD